MLLTGTITEILPPQERKQEFIVRYQDGQFYRELLFQLMQTKMHLIQDLREGDRVDVHYSIETKKGQTSGKYWTNCTCFKVYLSER